MVMVVITGNIVLGKRGSGKNTEEVWEPPVIMESMEEVKEEEPTEYSHIEFFSDQQRKDMVKQLGEQGLVSVTDDMNMENYQKNGGFLFCLYYRRRFMSVSRPPASRYP